MVDREKTTYLPQVTDKRYLMVLYTFPGVGVEPITSVVIGTNCIDSCKSNCHDHGHDIDENVKSGIKHHKP